MEMGNFFQMNDWEIRKFFSVVLAIQLTLWVLICIEGVGFKVPILRQLVGFLYLTFIPGLLILRALRLHRLNGIEALLYAVGLSVATLMFIGLFMNTVYPLIGISTPISLEPLIISISAFVSALCVLSYLRDRNFAEPNPINLKDAFSSPILFLCLLPFIAVLGTYLANFHQSNILLMILIPVIGALPVLAMAGAFKERLYPLAVFVIAVSLLYHTSLISSHLWGWDIQLEYYFSKLVLANGYWDSSLYGSTNGMLAIVMFAPIYSIVCNLNVVWVFKIIYPLLFALVPLAMYRLFQKQTSNKISFLACCFFMFVTVFYSEMIQLARQQIAELFFTLMLLSVVSEYIGRVCKSILLTLFGFSIVVSHYGTAYLLMFILIVNYLLLFLIGRLQHFWKKSHLQELFSLYKESALDLTFVITFMIVTLAWYMYIAGSHPFETLIRSAQIIFTEFVNPMESHAFYLISSKTPSPLHDVHKVLHFITQSLTVLGILDLAFMRKNVEGFNKEYFSLSIIFFAVWILSIIIPHYGFGFARVYHITLIVLSPYCIIGINTLAKILNHLLRNRTISLEISQLTKRFSIFLIIFLLFNAGWVYVIAKDNPSSIALSSIDYPCFSEKDVVGAKWLHCAKNDGGVYADSYRWLLLIGFEGYPYIWFQHYSIKSPAKLYVFLGEFNTRNGLMLEIRQIGLNVFRYYNKTNEIIGNMSKIYDNNGANIYIG